jgi:hypothetical protein
MSVSDQWIKFTFTEPVDKARFLALMEGCWAVVTAAGLGHVATIWQDGTVTDDELNAGFALMFEHCPWADGPLVSVETWAAQ